MPLPTKSSSKKELVEYIVAHKLKIKKNQNKPQLLAAILAKSPTVQIKPKSGQTPPKTKKAAMAMITQMAASLSSDQFMAQESQAESDWVDSLFTNQPASFKINKSKQPKQTPTPVKIKIKPPMARKKIKPPDKKAILKKNTQKEKDKTQSLIKSFLKTVKLGTSDEMMETIIQLEGPSEDNLQRVEDYVRDTLVDEEGMPQNVMDSLMETVHELDYVIDPEDGDENDWITFIKLLRERKINEFIETFRNKLNDTHSEINTQKYLQLFLKHIQ